MKKTTILLLFFFSLSLPVCAKDLMLGEKITLNEITKVSEINAQPEKYLGKKVLIVGIVIDVCAARGCWMDISSDEPFQKIQVKVVDGEIIFPLEARGRTARVEGMVEVLELSREQAYRYAKHKAEEQGREFDPAEVKGPTKIYRIRGLGAVIE